MVRVSGNGSGAFYLRNTSGDVLAKFDEEPSIYRPELIQDKAENVLAQLPDGSVDVILTDPPYGIEFDQNRYHAADLGTVANDSTLKFLDHVVPEFDRVLSDDGHLYMFTRWDAYLEMAQPLQEQFGLSTVVVWDKDDGGHGMGDLTNWAPRHEWAIHCRRDGAELNGRPPNVIRHQDVRFTDEPKMHPTQKPRGLMEEIITASSDVGDVILDPFGGSYAVGRAAQRTFRKSISCELDPETHRASVGLAEKELHDDPEYGVDWVEVSNLTVEETSIAESPLTGVGADQSEVSADD
jgi:site-specific DNA-methyltransferase (adenine-specific)